MKGLGIWLSICNPKNIDYKTLPLHHDLATAPAGSCGIVSVLSMNPDTKAHRPSGLSIKGE